MQFDAGRGTILKKRVSELYANGEFHRGQRRTATRCGGTVKECILIPKKQDKCKRIELDTDDGRGADTTVDLVLQATTKMFVNKVDGPEDAVVSEMIKRLPLERSIS